jgi:cell shape-determining protein MreC
MQENLEFRKLFGGKKDGGVFAEILAPSGSFPFGVFLLHIGSESGIKIGEIALADQNIALGKVIEIYPNSSKVKAFSSPGEATEAFLGPENIPVQLKGAGSGAFSAELPRDLDIREGDAAVLPGSDGFILAYVESKEDNFADSFQTLYLRVPVNIFELKYTQIIRSNFE